MPFEGEGFASIAKLDSLKITGLYKLDSFRYKVFGTIPNVLLIFALNSLFCSFIITNSALEWLDSFTNRF